MKVAMDDHDFLYRMSQFFGYDMTNVNTFEDNIFNLAVLYLSDAYDGVCLTPTTNIHLCPNREGKGQAIVIVDIPNVFQHKSIDTSLVCMKCIRTV